MNKKQKIFHSLIFAGTSLISIVGQTAANVSANDSIFGSIKNFFTKTKDEVPLKLQKEKIIEVSEIGISRRGALNVFLVSVAFFTAAITSIIASSKSLIAYSSLPLAALCSAAYFALVSVYETSKARRAITNLKGKIIEDMLNKQYTLKDFEEIVKDDEKCSEFVRQLLVLDRAPEDKANEESDKLPGNGELEEAKKTLKELFLEIDSVDKIKALKALPSNKKEELLKVIKPLSDWANGHMRSIFNKNNKFDAQKNTNFRSKIILLRFALTDAPFDAIESLGVNQFLSFFCDDSSENSKQNIYTKGLLEANYSFNISSNLKKLDSSAKEDLLLGSAKILFGDLKTNDIEKLDEEGKAKENMTKPLLDLVAEKYFSNFKGCENPKEKSIAVLNAIETWINEKVTNYTDSLYNRDGKTESFQDRINAVKSLLEKVGQEKV